MINKTITTEINSEILYFPEERLAIIKYLILFNNFFQICNIGMAGFVQFDDLGNEFTIGTWILVTIFALVNLAISFFQYGQLADLED